MKRPSIDSFIQQQQGSKDNSYQSFQKLPRLTAIHLSIDSYYEDQSDGEADSAHSNEVNEETDDLAETCRQFDKKKWDFLIEVGYKDLPAVNESSQPYEFFNLGHCDLELWIPKFPCPNEKHTIVILNSVSFQSLCVHMEWKFNSIKQTSLTEDRETDISRSGGD